MICEGDLDSASGGHQEFTVSVPVRHRGVPSLAGDLCLWVIQDLPSTGGELAQPDGPCSKTKAMEQGTWRTSWRSLCCEPGYRAMCRGSYRRANMEMVSLAQKKRISGVPKTVKLRCSRPCLGRLPFPTPTLLTSVLPWLTSSESLQCPFSSHIMILFVFSNPSYIYKCWGLEMFLMA